MNLKTCLSERYQMQKTTYCMIPFIGNAHRRRWTESRSVFVWGWGKDLGLSAVRPEGTFWSDGNVLKLDCMGDGGCTILYIS